MIFSNSTKPLTSLQFLLVVGLSLAAGAANADWPFARGGADSAGVASFALPSEPAMVWTFTADNDVALEATPVVAGGVAYFGDTEGTFYAVRMSDGTAIWRKSFEKTGFLSPAAFDGDSVYAPDMDGTVHCLAITDGAERWKFEASSEVYGGPIVTPQEEGATLLLPTEGGVLHALDAATGAVRWTFEIDAPLRCTPTIVQGHALLAGCDAKLHTVDVATGKETGSCDIGDPTGNTAALAAGVAYFGTESGQFHAVDCSKPARPTVKWSFRDPRQGQGVRTTAVPAKAAVVYANQAKTVYGLDPDNGKELWRLRTRSSVDASPLGLAGGRVLIATSRGRLQLIDGATGEAAWSYNAGGAFLAAPAASDGLVLLPNTDGKLYALGEE